MNGLRIVLTGSQGQVGWELQRALAPRLNGRAMQIESLMTPDRHQLDLCVADSIRNYIREHRPDVILNAAAYTTVDRAEQEPQLAMTINTAAPGIIGEEAQRIGAAVIHYSTDYVFDGTSAVPYTPDDEPNPLGMYGRSKLEGERALLHSGAAAIILRTCWVYSLRRRNFLLAVFRQAQQKPELRIVNDQVGCPTWARQIAQHTMEILASSVGGERGARSWEGREGLYHLAAAGSTTWYDFAREAFEITSFQPAPTIKPITTAEYPTPARRPAYSVLDCSATTATFGVTMVRWQDQLRACLQDDVHAALQAV